MTNPNENQFVALLNEDGSDKIHIHYGVVFVGKFIRLSGDPYVAEFKGVDVGLYAVGNAPHPSSMNHIIARTRPATKSEIDAWNAHLAETSNQIFSMLSNGENLLAGSTEKSTGICAQCGGELVECEHDTWN